ncbi:hypothetical protein TanjilG_23083 [Lupinus angustifolius]|uniref:Uncharacterized protein n=1 Tax=Lupinus angustifolius TaxID=3871 RepID=A0A1J7FZ68_LUPAN|nr:PREDICTED: vegetative cell wall protein gp1-like [Lupinus angustifolius]OIV93311.1 hypothetical protein TanjilG_23083 [Lupinus angustifolius]
MSTASRDSSQYQCCIVRGIKKLVGCKKKKRYSPALNYYPPQVEVNYSEEEEEHHSQASDNASTRSNSSRAKPNETCCMQVPNNLENYSNYPPPPMSNPHMPPPMPIPQSPVPPMSCPQMQCQPQFSAPPMSCSQNQCQPQYPAPPMSCSQMQCQPTNQCPQMTMSQYGPACPQYPSMPYPHPNQYRVPFQDTFSDENPDACNIM